jgi:hypothetical protein
MRNQVIEGLALSPIRIQKSRISLPHLNVRDEKYCYEEIERRDRVTAELVGNARLDHDGPFASEGREGRVQVVEEAEAQQENRCNFNYKQDLRIRFKADQSCKTI